MFKANALISKKCYNTIRLNFLLKFILRSGNSLKKTSVEIYFSALDMKYVGIKPINVIS
jgi:hypothetical protein